MAEADDDITMPMRIARGLGYRAHTGRIDSLKALEAAGYCRFLHSEETREHGKGQDYTLLVGEVEVVMLAREVEPWVAGIAHAHKTITGTDIAGIGRLYRPCGPIGG